MQKFLVYQKSTKNRPLSLGAQGLENWKKMGCLPRVYQMTDSCGKYAGFGGVSLLFRNFENGAGVSYSTIWGSGSQKAELISEEEDGFAADGPKEGRK